MAVSHPGNRDAAAQQRPHCSNGSVCMNRKTKKFNYLECKVKLIGMKKYMFFGAKKINSILCPRQRIDLDVSNFEY